ncbi:MAG: RNA 2',3'-cyclic phosphodiesterase [Patescibacteria group bacterium]|jgi:2'-5' RNA ligase
METDRLFLAIPLPIEVRKEIAAIAGHVHEQLRFSKVSWVPIENYHITLHFLGEFPKESQSDFVLALREKIYPNSFEIRLKEIGAFPSKKNPQTIFVETTIHPSLLGLRKRVGDVLASFGWSIDRRVWHSHVTIGRVKKRSEVLQPEKISVPPTYFSVRSFQLMKSTLGHEGSAYEIVSRFRLEDKETKKK